MWLKGCVPLPHNRSKVAMLNRPKLMVLTSCFNSSSFPIGYPLYRKSTNNGLLNLSAVIRAIVKPRRAYLHTRPRQFSNESSGLLTVPNCTPVCGLLNKMTVVLTIRSAYPLRKVFLLWVSYADENRISPPGIFQVMTKGLILVPWVLPIPFFVVKETLLENIWCDKPSSLPITNGCCRSKRAPQRDRLQPSRRQAFLR